MSTLQQIYHFLIVDFQKTSPSSETVGFLKKCQKADPPKIGHFRGGLLSSIFSKNHSKCPQMTLENHQKWGFQKVKFSKLQRQEKPCARNFFGKRKVDYVSRHNLLQESMLKPWFQGKKKIDIKTLGNTLNPKQLISDYCKCSYFSFRLEITLFYSIFFCIHVIRNLLQCPVFTNFTDTNMIPVGK